MKIRLIASVFFSAALFLTSCKDSDTFTISGTVKNPGKTGKVFLLATDSVGVMKVDSAALDGSGGFKFKYNAPYANLFKLSINDDIYDFVAQNGESFKFSTDLNDATHAYDISGSDASVQIKEFNRISNYYGSKNSKLTDQFRAETDGFDQEKKDAVVKKYMPEFLKNLDDNSHEVLKFVDKNKHSLAGFYAATSLDPIKYEQELVAYADTIKGDFKDNPAVRSFIRQMDAVKPVSVGHKAPEFTMTSIDGKQVKLSDYKGKYVMLDFWASWCAPCRRENPNVVKQYAKFHPKGFNILGISLDEEKSAWQGAIKADNLSWMHVSEMQRFEGPTERLYQVSAIPSNYIIDPNGNIAAKNITGADLEAFLNKTFN